MAAAVGHGERAAAAGPGDNLVPAHCGGAGHIGDVLQVHQHGGAAEPGNQPVVVLRCCEDQLAAADERHGATECTTAAQVRGTAGDHQSALRPTGLDVGDPATQNG